MSQGDKPGRGSDGDGKRRIVPHPEKSAGPAALKPGSNPPRATIPRGRLRLGRERPGRRKG